MSADEAIWIKSSRSLSTGACVELARDGDAVLVRHSKQPEVVIRYTVAEMAAFLEGVRDREFDHLLK